MTDEGDPPTEPDRTSGEGRVTVVGTAHVSQESVDEVEETIERERPDVVAVELDDARYRQLQGHEPEDLEANDLLHGNTVFQFLAYWMLSYIQTRLGKEFDVAPGAEMVAAVETAESLDIPAEMVDRDIQTTIQRFWARLTFREKLAMFGGLLAEMGRPRDVAIGAGVAVGTFLALPLELLAGPLVLPPDVFAGISIPILGTGTLLALLDGALIVGIITAIVAVPLALVLGRLRSAEQYEDFDVSELTDTDVVTAMMEEFRRFSPGGAEALIDERDAYIAHNLVALRDAGHHVVAVVGAGHRAGIEEYLEHPERLPPMDSLVGEESGRRFSLYKVVGYLITLGFLLFFVLLALAGVEDAFLLRVFGAWFIVNGLIAGGLALLAGAHLASAAVGGSVAWLTSVNPLLAPGWFAGYVELRYLDVNVGDISKLNEILDDEESPIRDVFARMREVPLFRLMLIVALTNVGSFIASMLFVATILPLFAGEVTCQTTTMFGTIDGMGCALITGAENGADILWSLIP